MSYQMETALGKANAYNNAVFYLNKGGMTC